MRQVRNAELYKLYSSPNCSDRTMVIDVQSRNLNVRVHLRCEYLDRERITGLAFKWPCAHHKIVWWSKDNFTQP